MAECEVESGVKPKVNTCGHVSIPVNDPRQNGYRIYSQGDPMALPEVSAPKRAARDTKSCIQRRMRDYPMGEILTNKASRRSH